MTNMILFLKILLSLFLGLIATYFFRHGDGFSHYVGLGFVALSVIHWHMWSDDDDGPA